MSHETNTFSPVPTPIARFGGGNGPAYGTDARRVAHGRSSSMAGMFRVAEASGAEIVTPIAAGAPPSGPVFDAAYEQMSDVICDAAAGCDALLLALHGAMVTETHEDGEGVLLARLRQLYPDIPIGVALDMHAASTGSRRLRPRRWSSGGLRSGRSLDHGAPRRWPPLATRR